MIFERPVIDRGDIIDSLGPIRKRNELSYKWLKREGLISAGIVLKPRERGEFRGTAVVLSALNRDAIAATRVEDWALAVELSHEASRLEQDLGAWLRDAESAQVPDEETEDDIPHDGRLWSPDQPARRLTRRLLRGMQDKSPMLLEGLSPLATELAAVRERFTLRLPLAETTLSRVWRIGPEQTELRPLQGGQPFAFLSREVLQAGLRLGDAVAVRHEEIAPGTVVTTLDPAVDSQPRRESLSGRRTPPHIEALLAEQPPPTRAGSPAPLRRVA